MRTTRKERLISTFDWLVMGALIGMFVGAVFGSMAAYTSGLFPANWWAWAVKVD